MRIWALLFLLFPLIELAVLIRVGAAIGVLPTLLLIVAGILLGGFLLRFAGLATALKARERLARGELPEREMLEGLLMAVGGGLLILPGFISDLLGLLCALPLTRRVLIEKIRRRSEDWTSHRRAFSDERATHSQPNDRHQVLEGEFERKD